MTLGPLMIDLEGESLLPDERERLRSPLVGGVILFTRNYRDRAQLAELTREIHAVRTPELLIAVDQEGGRVQRFREGFSTLPPARWFGHQYDLDPAQGRRLARLGGWVMAAELRDAGVDLSFAPCIDLDRGLSEIIGDRAFHNEPDVIVQLAETWMTGMRDAGMAAVAKHFPGHGGVVPDSHLELPVDHRDYTDLAEDIAPFQRLVAFGVAGIMVAHVRYPSVDRRIASLSPYWLQTELRDNLGFAGAVFSDDLTMGALAEAGSVPERARQSLEAGADMALICNDPEAAARTIAELPEDTGPASHGRLAAMRPRKVDWVPGELQGLSHWQARVAELEAALARPVLALDG
ncbi:MAG: beta-N-acetylhexosaminidase [Chromatiales bacterium]|nr:MAG: beta-N-acetylhexosaminidase [Chromatiales bacterium]